MYFALSDGRKLFYEIYGDPQGTPCFFFHGFPGSHLQAQIAHAQAQENHLKIIATDRPGLGYSDDDPQRTLQSTSQDIVQLAAYLKHSQFYLIGVSGGAPYAFATAHHLKQHVLGLILICPLGPLAESAFRNTYPRSVRWGMRFLQKFPGITKKLYKKIIQRFDQAPDVYMQRAARRLSERDQRSTQNPEVRNILKNSFLNSYRQSPEYAIKDLQIYTTPWGFHLNEIVIPVYLWHGTHDRIVPYQHSVLIHAAIPQSQLVTFPKEGHYSVAIEKLPQIMRQLKALIS